MIQDTFITYAAGLLAATESPLSSAQIVAISRRYSVEHNTIVPYESLPFPKGTPNKRTVLKENIKAFPPQQQYALLSELCNMPCFVDSKTELDPQNSNPRGAHGTEEERDPLDLIIKSFNERWFQGWEATPEEQRVKFVNIAQSMRDHPDFKTKYEENTDGQNREIAFKKIFEEVMGKQRKNEMDLYRLMTNDEAFKLAIQDTIKRMLAA